MFNSSFFCFVFLFNLILVVLKISKVLKLLISFEFLMLNVIFLVSSLSIPFETTLILLILATAASEAAVGLSLLVFLVRGNLYRDKSLMFI